jgi:hypothetical protein
MSGYYFLFTPNMSKTELPSTIMSVTPIVDRELRSFVREPDPVKLVLRNTENLTTTNNSKLNDKKLGESPKINRKISWQSVVVKPGDSLALIFSRLGFTTTDCQEIFLLIFGLSPNFLSFNLELFVVVKFSVFLKTNLTGSGSLTNERNSLSTIGVTDIIVEGNSVLDIFGVNRK